MGQNQEQLMWNKEYHLRRTKFIVYHCERELGHSGFVRYVIPFHTPRTFTFPIANPDATSTSRNTSRSTTPAPPSTTTPT